MILLEKKDLVLGRLIQRYKRFLADVELPGGETIVAHCPNSGSMATCWAAGDRVLMSRHDDPARKLKFTWIACEHEGRWLGIDTGVPNAVVFRAVKADVLPGLAGLRDVERERKYGTENSRIDVLARDVEGRRVYVEVKNTTMRQGDYDLFPDAVTERGTKHLRELMGVVGQGDRAALVFFVHREDVLRFDAAREIDPVYAETLDRAAAAGVLILPVQARLHAREGKEGLWSMGWSLDGLLPWIPRTGIAPAKAIKGRRRA